LAGHLVELFSHALRLSGEQVAVPVEGERCRCVPEHSLQDLDVGACRDGQ
jgi:hypothetical protein